MIPISAERRTAPRGRRGALLPTLIIVAVVVIAFLAFARFWTEWLWYDQLGFTQVLRTEWLSRVGLFVVAGGLMGAAIWVNLRLAYRNRPMYVPTTPQQHDLDRYREAFEPLRRVVFVAGPAVAAFFAGSAASTQWQAMLLAFNGQEFGQTDPQFNMDLSFFMFTLPFLRFVVSFLMTVTFFAAAVSIFTHYLYGGLQVAGPGQRISKAARIHIAVLAGLFVLFISANYWLDRYSLLSSTGDSWDGAGWTDVNAVIPARAILAIIGVLVAVLFFYTSARGTWRLPAIGVALMVIAGVLAAGVYPAVIQAVRVGPNEQSLEEEYIERNIEATRAAYGLDGIETTPYDAEVTAEEGQLGQDARTTTQIRLLDPTIVQPTFRQLQQNRPYYSFNQLSVDRYEIDGEMQDTVISVRELDMEQVENSWTNDHTVYTHGYGVVAAYGNTVSADGRPSFFQSGIPTSGALGEYEPRIYFSPNAPEYSIVGAPEGTTPWELDYPDDDADNGQQNYTYVGDGGPSVGNVWNQALFAARFGSEQILFSDRVTSESQVLYDRDPRERVAKVAPYLTLEDTTYPAVVDTDGDGVREVVWIVDAYTTSDAYPYSQHQTLTAATTDTLTDVDAQAQFAVPEINYIRNSVKAVVDAYTGEVTLYAWDTEDPVLQTWQSVYPNALQPVEEISGDLMGHLRYPEDMFKVQRELLTRYHVTDAATFYSEGDFWAVPNDPTQGQEIAQPPYYLTLQMPGQTSPSFSLSSSFIISGRQVLTGFLAVNSETGSEDGQVADDYGTLRLLELPRDLTVPGPGQVQNNFDSDTAVADELNILGRGNSEVDLGNLLTLPVGGGIMYVQPVYVQSAGDTQLPLLRRVLVSFGEEVGFAATLDEALDQVFGGDSGTEAGDADVDPVDPGNPGTGEGDGGEGGGDDGAVDAQQRLDAALGEAQQALADSEAALAEGDWTTYGEAQDRLSQAIADAIAAQEELDAAGGGAGDGEGDGAAEEPTDEATEESTG